MVEEAAKRFLAGESMAKLAEEYGVNHTSLHKTLTKRCGTEWVQKFDSDALNIHEAVTTTVPPLLPEGTIRAILQKVEANKTYHHGQLKHAHLFGRMVFCGHCGYAMFGQVNRNGHRYYRHAHTKRNRRCSYPKAWVRADELEETVIRDLFDCFGNPVAVQKAIEEAMPDRQKVLEYRERQERIAGELEKVKAARDRIIRFISKGMISEDEAACELDELRQREATLREQHGQITATLENVPTPDEVRATAERASASFKRVDAKLWAKKMILNDDFEGMPWADKRSLAELVFGGKTPEGKRMGVYVEWIEGQEARRRKGWLYRVVGHLIDQWGRAPKPPFDSLDPEVGEFRGGPMQKQLLEVVTKSATY